MAMHAVRTAALIQVGLGCALGDGGAHAIAVIHHQVDHRQVPQRCQVQRLVPGADVGGGVAHLADHHALAALVFQRVGRTGGQRQLPANDRIPAHEVAGGIEQVHRAAAPARHAGLFAEQLGHHRARRNPTCDNVAVLAIVGEDIVCRRQRRRQADNRRLFAQIEVAVTADFGLRVHLAGALFEAADQQHLVVVVFELLGVLARQIAPYLGGAVGLHVGLFRHY
jgi:hypothetical protein